MQRPQIHKTVKRITTAVLFSSGLIAISILLKSETPIEHPIEVHDHTSQELSVYDRPVLAVESKGFLRKDYNRKHIHEAQKVGVLGLSDAYCLEDFVQDQLLLPVKEDKGYLIGDMTHSYPYLTEDAILMLRKIGASFYEASGDSSAIYVSSLTRTNETQRKLRRRNANASKSESSHCYGVSFDISYIRYNGVKEWHYERTKILEGILANLQKSGEIYVLKERNQSCFHVTVRQQVDIKKGAQSENPLANL